MTKVIVVCVRACVRAVGWRGLFLIVHKVYILYCMHLEL